MNSRRERVLAMLRDIQRVDGLAGSHVEEVVERRARTTLAVESSAHPLRLREAEPSASAVLDSWHRFERNEPLTPEDHFHLESIVLFGGVRPSFDILNDSFTDLPSLWQEINDHRGALEPLIRGIGRLDLVGHPSHTYGGTAFVCGDRRIITNRHVAQLFLQGVGDRAHLQFTSGISSKVDLKQEVNSSVSTTLTIVAPVLVLDEWDIAVLEVDSLPVGVAPLRLASAPLANPVDRLAVIVGYPGFDPVENLREQLHIFRSVFDKKRLQPGRLKGTLTAQSFGRAVQALGHDCSTLGGNSGSAVIDVVTATVVGVHFAGQPLVANYAVPTWSLASNQQVMASGVAF